MLNQYLYQFQQAAEEKNDCIIEAVEADARIHRCGTVGKENRKDGSYAFYTDGRPSGWCINFRTGEKMIWVAESDTPLTFQERMLIDKRNKERKKEEKRRQKEAALEAHLLRESLSADVDLVPYLKAKGVVPAGELRAKGERLFVPVFGMSSNSVVPEYFVQSGQFIDPNGAKRFLTGGKVRDGFFLIGDADGTDVIYIVEGVATGLSVFEATKKTVFCALSGSNMKNITGIVKKWFPLSEVVIAADAGEAGRDYALKASSAIEGIKVAFPKFQEGQAGNDFNDLHQEAGLDEVLTQLQNARRQYLPMDSGILHTIGFDSFLEVDIPEREMVLGPCVPEKGIVMVYASRGLGKTYVCLSMALAIATGGSTLRWTAEKPRRVVYVDGEMAAYEMQQRLKSLLGGFGEMPDESYLQLLSMDYCGARVPNLSTKEGQAAIDNLLGGVDVIFLDNLSMLCGGDENSAEAWDSMQAWLFSLRQRGITVIFVHHANKEGGQRGTSRREDIVDTTIALKKHKDHDPSQGACFEVHYEKNRGFMGKDAKPFSARLQSDDEGNAYWDVEGADGDALALLEMVKGGMSVEEAGKALGKSRSTAYRLKKKAEAM